MIRQKRQTQISLHIVSVISVILVAAATRLLGLSFFIDMRSEPSPEGYPPSLDADAVAFDVLVLLVGTGVALSAAGLQTLRGRSFVLASVIGLISLTRFVTRLPLPA